MQHLDKLIVEGSAGKPISFDITLPDTDQPAPLVIFSHGFKGFKDWGHFNLVAQQFAKAGFVFLKHNFSHNGTTPEKPSDFADLEAFGNNNFSIEVDDLKIMIDHSLKIKELQGRIIPEQVYLMGHSRGGGITLLAASEEPRVKKVITWASVSRFGHFWDEEVVAQWKADGVMYIPNSRTKQQMPMYYQSYEDFYAHADRLDIPKATCSLEIPLLIVHAEDDPVVLADSARELKSYKPDSELFVLPEGGHTFGAKHPWDNEELPQPADQVIAKSIEFFKA